MSNINEYILLLLSITHVKISADLQLLFKILWVLYSFPNTAYCPSFKIYFRLTISLFMLSLCSSYTDKIIFSFILYKTFFWICAPVFNGVVFNLNIYIYFP